VFAFVQLFALHLQIKYGKLWQDKQAVKGPKDSKHKK